MGYELKKLTVGGILDWGIQILGEHFGTLFQIKACTVLPSSIILGIQAHAMERDESAATLLLYIAVVLFHSLVVAPLSHAAVLSLVSRSYLGHSTTLGESFELGKRRLGPLIVTGIMTFIVILGGTLLFIIPGILCAIWFSLVEEVTLLERCDGAAALGRSKALIQKNMGTAILLGIVIVAIAIPLNLIAGLFPAPLDLLISAMIACGLGMLSGCVWSVFYFACRCDDEGFGAETLAQEIGVEHPGKDGISSDRAE